MRRSGKGDGEAEIEAKEGARDLDRTAGRFRCCCGSANLAVQACAPLGEGQDRQAVSALISERIGQDAIAKSVAVALTNIYPANSHVHLGRHAAIVDLPVCALSRLN
jgi:hypothetical protein